MERGAILGKKKFQSPGGKDTARFRKPHAAGAS